MYKFFYLSRWLILEGVFFGLLIAFGVYVIYYTWSFQRKNLIAETRWVLAVLYNIIVNGTAIIPVLSLSAMNDENLSILVMVSILFSGGGVIFAFLLPRLFKLSSSEDSSTTEVHRSQVATQSDGHKCKNEQSDLKTPTVTKRDVRSDTELVALNVDRYQSLSDSRLPASSRSEGLPLEDSPFKERSEKEEKKTPELHPRALSSSGSTHLSTASCAPEPSRLQSERLRISLNNEIEISAQQTYKGKNGKRIIGIERLEGVASIEEQATDIDALEKVQSEINIGVPISESGPDVSGHVREIVRSHAGRKEGEEVDMYVA